MSQCHGPAETGLWFIVYSSTVVEILSRSTTAQIGSIYNHRWSCRWYNSEWKLHNGNIIRGHNSYFPVKKVVEKPQIKYIFNPPLLFPNYQSNLTTNFQFITWNIQLIQIHTKVYNYPVNTFFLNQINLDIGLLCCVVGDLFTGLYLRVMSNVTVYRFS